ATPSPSPLVPPARPPHYRIRPAQLTNGGCRTSTEWQGEIESTTGRTLEESFALQNLQWTQEDNQADLGLRVVKRREASPEISEMQERIFRRVRSFDKTRFALNLMTADMDAWVAPTYIAEGLRWLSSQLGAEVIEAVPNLRAGTDA
ncbi:hypothetical protein ACFXJ8_42905, partial [Nonomuraea sp. NPDC059194]